MRHLLDSPRSSPPDRRLGRSRFWTKVCSPAWLREPEVVLRLVWVEPPIVSQCLSDRQHHRFGCVIRPICRRCSGTGTVKRVSLRRTNGRPARRARGRPIRATVPVQHQRKHSALTVSFGRKNCGVVAEDATNSSDHGVKCRTGKCRKKMRRPAARVARCCKEGRLQASATH